MLGAAFAPLVVVVVLAMLLRRQRAEARRDAGGTLTLEYGTAWRALGIVIGLVWTALFAFLFVESPPKPDDVPAMVMLIAIATATVVPYVVTVYGVAYRFDDRGIDKRSPWSRNFRVVWSDVSRVSFNATLGQFVLETSAGRIRVSRLLNGLKDFRLALEQHVPADARTAAKSQLDTIRT